MPHVCCVPESFHIGGITLENRPGTVLEGDRVNVVERELRTGPEVRNHCSESVVQFRLRHQLIMTRCPFERATPGDGLLVQWISLHGDRKRVAEGKRACGM